MSDIFNHLYQLHSIFLSIIKAHLLIVLLLTVSYLIESKTTLRLFIKQFQWKKSKRNAEIHRDGDSVYYFVFVAIVYIYDIYFGNVEFNVIGIFIWLLVMIPLWILFRKYYDKYQAVDPNKADDDYS